MEIKIKNKTKRQSSQYDKIFKENIEVVIPSLINNLLGIKAIALEELPDDIQHTKERKPDILKKVLDEKGQTFILQIEFQVANDNEMSYRMLEYKAMLFRKYRLPIFQYVIFLGTGKMKMDAKLHTNELIFSYNLLALNSIDYKIFINSAQPEEIILSILANFSEETSEDALKHIIQRLEETTNGDLALKRYFKQLRILSQLRKLEHKLKTIIMDNIAKYIDEEKDVAFLVGREKEQTKFVAYLLNEGTKTVHQIADIAGVTVAFVKSVKQKLAVNIH